MQFKLNKMITINNSGALKIKSGGGGGGTDIITNAL
jgi:hypothetical protein